MKSFAQDDVKRRWREWELEQIVRCYTPGERRNLRVLCMPSHEMCDVDEILLPAGIKPKNIYGVEGDPDVLPALEARNNARDRPIKIHPGTVTEVLQRWDPANKIDVFLLDWCDYMDLENIWPLRIIASRELMSSKGMLITNYLAGREWKKVQADLRRSSFFMEHREAIDRMKFKEYVDFLNQNEDIVYAPHAPLPVEEGELSDRRDTFTQTTPWSIFFNGKQLWNIPLIRSIAETSPQREILLEALARISSADPGTEEDTLKRWLYNNEDPIRRSMLDYIMMTQQKPYLLEHHSAATYVSDSGQRFNSDAFLFRHPSINPPVRNAFTYRVEDGQVRITRDMRKFIPFFLWWNDLTEEINTKVAYWNDRLPEERIDINALYERERGPIATERAPAAKHYSPKTSIAPEDEAGIRERISAGMKAPEIAAAYNGKYPWQQIAAYKARLRISDPQTVPQKRGRIDPEDLEIIIDLAAQGTSKDIAALFDGKYSWQQIAGVKAAQTKAMKEDRGTEAEFRRVRPAILERDNHQCVYCNHTEAENRQRSGHGLHIHHIDYDHSNNSQLNMVALCTTCHVKTNIVQYATQMRAQLERYIFSRMTPEQDPAATGQYSAEQA